MACLRNVNRPNRISVCSLSKYYITVHGKFYKQQMLLHSNVNSSSEKSKVEESNCDQIGPPDSVSNLRPMHFHIPADETPLEKQFRLKRQEVQQWNQDFWTSHNLKFVKERKEFIATNQPQDCETSLSADEMSVFYKAFLDKNWRTHLNYNVEWYKKNAHLVLLHVQAKLSRLRGTLKENVN